MVASTAAISLVVVMNGNPRESSRSRGALIGTRTARGVVMALISFVLLATTDIGANAAEPSLKDALEAPAGDIAQAYLSTNHMLENVLPYAEMGVVGTIHVGGEKITQEMPLRIRNVIKKGKRYTVRRFASGANCLWRERTVE